MSPATNLVVARARTRPAPTPIAEPPASGEDPAVAPPLLDLRGLSLLVVDDDALARTAVVELLRSWGCLVHPAAGGEEAMAVAGSIRAPDLIACDFRLPGGQDAIELVARLRGAFGANVPAFLVSGDTDPDVLRAAEASGLMLLHKPVRPARLRALIHRLARPSPG